MESNRELETLPFSEIEILHKKINLLLDYFDIDRSIFEPDDGLTYYVADQYGRVLSAGAYYTCERYIRRFQRHMMSFRLRIISKDDYYNVNIWETQTGSAGKKD